MPTKAKGGWYEVLLAVRRVADERKTFTAYDLADVAGMTPNMASGWLSKFVSWRYVKRAGTERGERRWVRAFSLTEYGAERKRPALKVKFVKG